MLPAAVTTEQLQFFAELIERELGIVYNESNSYQLERRIHEVARQLGHADPGAFLAAVRQGVTRDVKDLILDVATNNETSFFRDPSTFKALEDVVVPALRVRFPGRGSFRFWSAAASTGQEAFSIVLTFRALRAKDPSCPDAAVLASDVSHRVLKRARTGEFSQMEVQRGLPARLLVQWFEKRDEKTWVIKKDVAQSVEFLHLNLLGPWVNVPRFHVVFCRNVLIYQSRAKKREILQRIHDQLLPGGFLVLGGTESLLGLDTPFVPLKEPGAHAIYEKPVA